MEVYAVVWGTGSCDDYGSAHAYAGVHGIYKSEASAKKALEECKNEIYEEIMTSIDPNNEFPNLREEVQVYGSAEIGSFDIDYTLGTEPVEVTIRITTACVHD